MKLPRRCRQVQQALDALHLDCEIVELPQTTRTAVEAAAAIGCEVAQIAKSIVFRGAASDAPVLVLASGRNRIDTARVAAQLGEPLGKADADYVRAQTGFAIGGVPPLGHCQPLAVYFDEDLQRFDEVWAAAGTPFAIFRMRRTDLAAIAAGRFTRVC